MLLLKQSLLQRVRAATRIAEIQEMLTSAFTLELATLPTYLTGAFSVVPGYNREALALAQSVAYEEMLHMTLACNLLISIGGDPDILNVGLGLRFPTPLPDMVDPGLTVEVKAMTLEQVGTVYMGIERPATSALLPGETEVPPEAKRGFDSIGDFYAAILQKLEEFSQHSKDPFAHPRLERQVDVSQWFPPVEGLGKGQIYDLPTAQAAVNVIVSQGEGAQVSTDPLDPYGGFGNSFAHYFKFGEIFHGHRLVKDCCAPSGWSFTGDEVPHDPAGIYDLLPNAALSDYVPGSAAHIAGQEFYGSYRRLLTALNEVFNGSPERLGGAVCIMFELKLLAQKVVIHPADPNQPDGPRAAPPFMLTKQALK